LPTSKKAIEKKYGGRKFIDTCSLTCNPECVYFGENARLRFRDKHHYWRKGLSYRRAPMRRRRLR